MAWNPSPKVAEARNLAKKYSKTKVIIFMIDDEAGTMEFASFGKDRAMCSEAQKLGNVAYKAIYDHLGKKCIADCDYSKDGMCICQMGTCTGQR